MHETNTPVTWYFLTLAIIYTVLIFVLPANTFARHAYNLSSSRYHVVLFAVAIPTIIYWLIAFYGYARFSDYAQVVKATAEGDDITRVARGVKLIAWGLPIPSIISLIVNSIANANMHFRPAALAITNYTILVIILLAFSAISTGGQGLAARAKVNTSPLGNRIFTLMLVTLGVIFCALVFRHVDLNHITNSDNTFFMPTWLAVLSVIIPYLYAWFIGLFVAYESYWSLDTPVAYCFVRVCNF